MAAARTSNWVCCTVLVNDGEIIVDIDVDVVVGDEMVHRNKLSTLKFRLLGG